jgi:alpha-L-rhamnosidase
VLIRLGNGWYGQTWKGRPAARLEIHGEGGLIATTSADWQAAAGPIVEDGVYLGETYDARRENPAWSKAAVADLRPAMTAQAMPAIEVIDTVAPASMSNPAPGAYVFDMGQNITGWARIRVRGEAGSRVRIRYAESLRPDGTLDTDNLRYARSTDYYILSGRPEGEEWEPRFTYHGFRYVEVTGLPGPATLETVRGRVVHSKMRQTGTFASSQPVLNGIARMTLWTLRGNWMSIPTDGAQRDERMGWMADAHLASEAAMLYFDTEALYANFLRNIADEQGPNGEVPDVAPHKTFGHKRGDPAWASGYPLMAWYSWQRFGDRRVLERHFEGMRRWADFLSTQASGDLIDYSYYGDWVALEPTPGPLVSSVYYYVSVDTVAKAAQALGRREEEAKYRALAERIRAAFVKRWPPSDTTQTASVLPLWFGITPAGEERHVLQDLVNRIIYGSNAHLTTGIHGTKYVFPLLTRHARSELAYDLLTAEDYPSFGYMLSKGATTFWEIWQHRTGPRMNSHNHPAFAAAGAWLVEGAAGINVDPSGPGYARVRVEPQILRDVQWASASVDTPRGEVLCEWKRVDGGAEIRVKIPVGSTASIHIPKLLREKVEVFEGGRAVWRENSFVPGAAGLTAARQTGYPVHTVIFEAGSGEFRFTMRNELAPL